MASQGPLVIAMRLRNQLQSVYKMDPLRNEAVSCCAILKMAAFDALKVVTTANLNMAAFPKEVVKVKMKELNEHIVCYLCAGYFIDATTITECLHTFCKSCLVKYLQTSKYCPLCNIKIHETQPLLNLKLDRVLQDIVYKLVPGLQENEDSRIRDFYHSRGLERVLQSSAVEVSQKTSHYYRNDEHVCLCLEKVGSGKDKKKFILQKFVRCSVRSEIRHLRGVLSHRLSAPLAHVQLLIDNKVLPDHMTMKQLWLMHWYGKPAPLVVLYSVREKRR